MTSSSGSTSFLWRIAVCIPFFEAVYRWWYPSPGDDLPLTEHTFVTATFDGRTLTPGMKMGVDASSLGVLPGDYGAYIRLPGDVPQDAAVTPVCGVRRETGFHDLNAGKLDLWHVKGKDWSLIHEAPPNGAPAGGVLVMLLPEKLTGSHTPYMFPPHRATVLAAVGALPQDNRSRFHQPLSNEDEASKRLLLYVTAGTAIRCIYVAKDGTVEYSQVFTFQRKDNGFEVIVTGGVGTEEKFVNPADVHAARILAQVALANRPEADTVESADEAEALPVAAGDSTNGAGSGEEVRRAA